MQLLVDSHESLDFLESVVLRKDSATQVAVLNS